MICKMEDCPNPILCREMCRAHYKKWYRDPDRVPERYCAVEWCDKSLPGQNKTGYCNDHRRLNPARVQADKDRSKAWREANPDKVRQQQIEWEAANPDKVKAKQQRYRANNPQKILDRNAARRATKMQVTVEEVDRTVVFQRDNGVCHLCGHLVDPDNWHLEHIIPLIRGGEHSYANTAVSHPDCNLKKGDKIL